MRISKMSELASRYFFSDAQSDPTTVSKNNDIEDSNNGAVRSEQPVENEIADRTVVHIDPALEADLKSLLARAEATLRGINRIGDSKLDSTPGYHPTLSP